MFRNHYQRHESKEGHREVGEKGEEVNARESVPELFEAGYMTQSKNDGVEEDLEKADYGDMKEEVYVHTGEETLDDSRCGSLHQLPPSERLRPTDAQADDSQPAESSPDVIAKNIFCTCQVGAVRWTLRCGWPEEGCKASFHGRHIHRGVVR